MRVPWWLGLDAAVADVSCDGTVHQVRWAAGRLHADAHAADLEAEEALAALGGTRAGCLALVDLWQRYESTPALVTLGRRPGEPPVGTEVGVVVGLGEPAEQPAGSNPEVEAMLRRRSELLTLLSLPGPLVDRLVLTAMASCGKHWDDDGFRAEHGLRLGAALSARAGPALRRFGVRLGRGEPAVTVAPSQPAAGPALLARLEPHQPPVVNADLPLRWLVDVWGRGVSEPDGRLVLAVRDSDESGRELLVDLAEWEPAGPITWELAAVPARLVVDDSGRWKVADALS